MWIFSTTRDYPWNEQFVIWHLANLCRCSERVFVCNLCGLTVWSFCCAGTAAGLSWRSSGFCCLGGWIFQTDSRCPSLPLHWGSTFFRGTESAERLPRTHLVKYTVIHLTSHTVLSLIKTTPPQNPSKASSLLAFVVSDISVYQCS